MKMNNTIITRQLVPNNLRMKTVNDLFGLYFPMRIEPFIYAMAEELTADNDACNDVCDQYRGGLWEFYTLSNGGFFMAPDMSPDSGKYTVSSQNGFEGKISAMALGVISCMFAFSHLSFSDNEGLSEVATKYFHLLRSYALDHPEAASIFQATD